MLQSFYKCLRLWLAPALAGAFLCEAPIWSASASDASGSSAPAAGRIVILGDSLTSGYGLDDPAREAYPALLQDKIRAGGWNALVVNAGISGDTTAGGLRRVDWAIRDGVDILIIALGGNDGLRGIDPPQTSANLAGIIRATREKFPEAQIVLAGMRMPGSMGKNFAEQFAAIYPDLAKKQNVTLIPFLLEGVGGDPALNQPDLIHPTAEGQKRIAETVWKSLEPLLKKKSTR
ncbi:arylesterase [Oscillatoria amoena NRMC-F 0135]|nr:arylesterase [Oscillatoria laete-virens]MDL5047516.1 arylesterase [Oscillatoria amoena NRMC-F 0135]MDL5054659.1 arylesterase [Oscillatoria laete-virens NRMC-F 0139]